MWNPSGPGIEPLSPTLAGRFLTTGDQGSPLIFNIEKKKKKVLSEKAPACKTNGKAFSGK